MVRLDINLVAKKTSLPLSGQAGKTLKENRWALLKKRPSQTILRKEITNRNLTLLYTEAHLHQQVLGELLCHSRR